MSYVIRITGISGITFWLDASGKTVSDLKHAKRFPSKVQADIAAEAHWDTIALALHRYMDITVLPTEQAEGEGTGHVAAD